RVLKSGILSDLFDCRMQLLQRICWRKDCAVDKKLLSPFAVCLIAKQQKHWKANLVKKLNSSFNTHLLRTRSSKPIGGPSSPTLLGIGRNNAFKIRARSLSITANFGFSASPRYVMANVLR